VATNALMTFSLVLKMATTKLSLLLHAATCPIGEASATKATVLMREPRMSTATETRLNQESNPTVKLMRAEFPSLCAFFVFSVSAGESFARQFTTEQAQRSLGTHRENRFKSGFPYLKATNHHGCRQNAN